MSSRVKFDIEKLVNAISYSLVNSHKMISNLDLQTLNVFSWPSCTFFRKAQILLGLQIFPEKFL